MYQDLRVTDLMGNQIGTLVPVPRTTLVIVKDMMGQNLINQLDLAQVQVLKGDPENCTTKPPVQQPDISISSCIDAWYLVADNKYLIYADRTVTNEAGTQVGTITPVPNTTLANMVDMSGNPIINNVNLAQLPVVTGDNIRYKIVEPAFHLKDATGNYIIYQSTVVTNPAGVPVGYADFATGTIKGLDNVTPITVANFASLPILSPGGKCVDYEPIVVSSSSSAPVYSSSSSEPPTPKSSSSVVKSSSSVVKSSSSSAPKSSSSSAPPAGGCPTIKTKSGGRSGSGWATRYWDCCKPHCSWPEHANGNYSKQCSNKGKNESTDWGGGSVCSGGGLMTCTSQIPFTVDGCDEIGFAFAAVPASDGGSCGKCFQLTFTGTGKYSTDNNHRAIKGKKLIIMTTNIGGDVQHGQFDIMIPGGGVGMFNGCSSMGWGAQGEQYGGLLSDCEKSSNYVASKTLSCLKDKCNSVFSNDSEAKKGCMFLAEWMHAAGNPEHNYVEVECPEVLKAKY